MAAGGAQRTWNTSQTCASPSGPSSAKQSARPTGVQQSKGQSDAAPRHAGADNGQLLTRAVTRCRLPSALIELFASGYQLSMVGWRCRKEAAAREEALKTNLKSKKTDEQAREKAQKAQQDEAERVQQQAANKARLAHAAVMAAAS